MLVKPFTIHQLKKCLLELYPLNSSELSSQQSHTFFPSSQSTESATSHRLTSLSSTLSPQTVGLDSLNLKKTPEIDMIRSKVLSLKKTQKIPSLPSIGGLRATNDINKSPSRTISSTTPKTIGEFSNTLPIDPFTKNPNSIISNSNLTVLCADDNLMNQKLISKFLNVLGYNYVFANDGQYCCELYIANPSKYCLILMDCSMPVV